MRRMADNRQSRRGEPMTYATVMVRLTLDQPKRRA